MKAWQIALPIGLAAAAAAAVAIISGKKNAEKPSAPAKGGAKKAEIKNAKTGVYSFVSGFSDASTVSTPYVAAVKWGVENKIIQGYGDDTFRPDQTISRAQMATFVYRYMKNVAEYDFGEVKAAEFDDAAEIAAPFVDAVNALVSAGIVKGVTANTFDPNGVAVRGAAATVLVRMVHLLTLTV